MSEFERLWNEIGEGDIMTLSTCADNRVTSRQMSVVVMNGRFYCQTNKNYLKCRQTSQNPNVSLCFGKFTVEGLCRDIGRPFDNCAFIRAMGNAFPDAVKRWSGLAEECVLEISPTLIRSWIYENNIPYIEIWDIAHTAYRKERQ